MWNNVFVMLLNLSTYRFTVSIEWIVVNGIHCLRDGFGAQIIINNGRFYINDSSEADEDVCRPAR